MPQPTVGDVSVNRALNDISVAFAQEADDFAFRQVFPEVMVPQKSNDYYVWDKDMLRRSEAAKRGPGSEAAERGQELTTQSYSADVWAVKQGLAEQVQENQDPAVNYREGITEGLMQDMMINIENEFASNYMTSGTWNRELDGSGNTDFTQWDDSSSTPIQNITDEMVRMKRITGFSPNVLVLGLEVFNELRNNSQLIDRVKNVSSGPVTREIMQGLFGIDNIVVSEASQNTADEGATGSDSFIVGKTALLAYAPDSPGLFQPSAGYRFTWSGMSGAQDGIRVLEYPSEETHEEMIEVETAFDMHVVGQDLGTLFYNAVA